MAIPTINVKSVKRKTKTVYLLDYSLHGKRHRKIVADKKKDAELIRAKSILPI